MRMRGKQGQGKRLPLLAVLAATFAICAVLLGIKLTKDPVALPPPAVTQPGTTAIATTSSAAQSLELRSTLPASGATDVAPDSEISVTFSAPLSQSSPSPTLAPPVAGSWQVVAADTMKFVPSESFVPYTKEVVSIPGGPGGITGAQGQTLGSASTFSFSIAPGSVLRLQQLLAQLDYLPLAFSPQSQAPVQPSQMALPESGSFVWRWPTLSAPLSPLWSAGKMNVVTKGAVMEFENQMGLSTDGLAGPLVWEHLLDAVAAETVNSAPYDYVVVSTALPQSVTVYQNGVKILETPANTGVAAAPTIKGTFPVYLRYQSTTMSGTNPDGTHYVDYNVPWVSYFNGGQGLHGFVRPGYGYPQSVGCVEMPIPTAARVWPLTPIGTLVTVV